MASISDLIEQYLKRILQKSPQQMIEIQRNELAEQFQCVPSQINYVISTRFTLEKGYLVESKRGGGGYVRIQKISLPKHDLLEENLLHFIGQEMDQNTADGFIFQLEEAEVVTEREAHMLKAVVSREVLSVPLPYRDELRAKILKAALIAVLSKS